MNKIFTQLIEARHLTEGFIHPRYEDLLDPFLLPDMDKAVERIDRAVKTNEKILIYGDYDVDGVTASALMEQALKLTGVSEKQIRIMLPDRFADGYGMSKRLIKKAKQNQIPLVITVDCGSRNHDIINELNLNHIDTIVTDHHECSDDLPKAVAVINPHRHDYQGPDTLKNLAGVGVAFKLAQALVKKNLIKDGQEKWLLDLVLLGTICDSMILTQENRILTYYGKIVLEKTRRPGLKELIKNAKIKSITSETVGFRIGPRLNAAGRLDTAKNALNLLRTTSVTEGAALARNLEDLNAKRRNKQRAAVSEIEKRFEEDADLLEDSPVIIETGNWHEGIIGIVAGRLVEEYHRPAFVLTETKDGILKGSGRSFGDFNLAEALDHVRDIIEGGGGHAAAAGVQLKRENLFEFREKINAYYQSLNLKDQERFLRQSADLDIDKFDGFDLSLLKELSVLEPFGPGNEEPIFCIKGAIIIGTQRMGQDGEHLRLGIRTENDSNRFIRGVAFSAPKSWFYLPPFTRCSMLIKPIENDWNGIRSLEARLIGIIW